MGVQGYISAGQAMINFTIHANVGNMGVLWVSENNGMVVEKAGGG